MKKFRKLILESYIRISIEFIFMIILLFMIATALRNFGEIVNILIFYPLILIYLFKFIKTLAKQSIYLKNLNIGDYKNLQLQIEKPIFYSKWNYILLDDYLINIKRFKIIKYSDIVLMYKRYRLTMGNSYYLAKYLYVYTNKNEKIKFLIKYPFFGPFIVDDISIVIKEKNPNVIIGRRK